MGVKETKKGGKARRKQEPLAARTCARCGATYTPSRAWSRYCGEKCQREANRLAGEGGSPRTRAVISELRAAADLLGHGFDVYRALSPESPALLVIRNGNHLTVEVRTAYQSEAGSLVWNKVKDDGCDHVALVLPDKVIYEPPLTARE